VSKLPPSPPQDRTLAFTAGQYGGFYFMGGRRCWRLCVGFVAVTYLRAEFTNVMEAWLDAAEPVSAEGEPCSPPSSSQHWSAWTPSTADTSSGTSTE
jgi:hypothetical protein